jgi:hypothetical protein
MHLLPRKIALATKPFVLLLICATVALTQSGRSGMRGYVAFEDLSYNDVAEHKVHARIELRRTARDKDVVTTETDEHGLYDFHSVSPGEYLLRISSPGYRVYETEIYLPSDFIGNLAVMLKKEKH